MSMMLVLVNEQREQRAVVLVLITKAIAMAIGQ
jgi:hypothetical protein